MPVPSRVVDLHPLDIRADVLPSSFNAEARTVDVVFSSGAAVDRFDWWTGKRYTEKLSLKPEHVRLDRLNNGGPVLDTHEPWSVRTMLGTVVQGSAKIVGKQARATIKFSSREDVAGVVKDVAEGIVRNVSVGYRVHKFEEETKGEQTIRTAIDWEPYEISMVPMPADMHAQTRGAAAVAMNRCEIVDAAPSTQERVMPEPNTNQPAADQSTDATRQPQSEFVVQPHPLASDTPPATTRTPPAEPNDHDRGRDAERGRIQGILNACRAARLPQAFADGLIAQGLSLVDAQSRVFTELARRDTDVPRGGASAPSVQVHGDDPLVHERRGIENALLHRVSPTSFKLEDHGRRYRGLTLLETAKIFLQAKGIRTTDMSKNQIAAAALGLDQRVGYHTTSDFPLLLADVAAKTLRREYEQAPATYTLIGRRVTLPDYKPSNRLELGEAPALLEVKEHGEYTHGTIGEGREQMQLIKYGRKFAITREALINDDIDAFSRVPAKFGRAARNLESNLAWLQILSNPVMGDGNALFSTAHANTVANGTVINITSVGAGRAAMRLQTGIDSDGQTFINAAPRYLIVPPSLETKADQFVSPIMAAVFEQANPLGTRLSVVSEPRLETGIGSVAGSPIAWYLAASVEQVDILEYGYLDGEEGPQIESRVGFDIDGLEIKCRLDFAAKVVGWRGIYKDPGELES